MNSVRQQVVQDVWDGLTVSQQVWLLHAGTTDVAFTVLDVLGYLDEIPVCVGYDIDGEVTTDFPVTHLLEKQNRYIRHFQDGRADIRGIKKIRGFTRKLPQIY